MSTTIVRLTLAAAAAACLVACLAASAAPADAANYPRPNTWCGGDLSHPYGRTGEFVFCPRGCDDPQSNPYAASYYQAYEFHADAMGLSWLFTLEPAVTSPPSGAFAQFAQPVLALYRQPFDPGRLQQPEHYAFYTPSLGTATPTIASVIESGHDWVLVVTNEVTKAHPEWKERVGPYRLAVHAPAGETFIENCGQDVLFGESFFHNDLRIETSRSLYGDDSVTYTHGAVSTVGDAPYISPVGRGEVRGGIGISSSSTGNRWEVGWIRFGSGHPRPRSGGYISSCIDRYCPYSLDTTVERAGHNGEVRTVYANPDNPAVAAVNHARPWFRMYNRQQGISMRGFVGYLWIAEVGWWDTGGEGGWHKLDFKVVPMGFGTVFSSSHGEHSDSELVLHGHDENAYSTAFPPPNCMAADDCDGGFFDWSRASGWCYHHAARSPILNPAWITWRLTDHVMHSMFGPNRGCGWQMAINSPENYAR